ncbi:MAG: transaldolase [Chloroflexota bacterium]|nr:transaldolase [Chloroflexota bacterium]
MSVGPLDAAVAARLAAWETDAVAERMWRKDGTLWSASGTDPGTTVERLGWLDLPATMPARIAELVELAAAARDDGFVQAAVLGMGGSSLAPELFARVFGLTGEGLELRVLDSTHPDAVRRFREWASRRRTLFLVSSKSGTTTEPLAFHAAMGEIAGPDAFVAITDPGTPLEETARTARFRAGIAAPADVGGRYSALTVFGLVPAALAGVDVAALIERAAAMADACREPATRNPGLALGAWLGEAAAAGRDKLTLLTSPALAAFGDWVEQLIAESTGKRGRGIVPVVGEPLGAASAYGDDRAFVTLTVAGDPDDGVLALADELRRLGHPVRRVEITDPLELGGEFVRWEIATASAGMVLEIDPFDQPNVQESKDATTALLRAYRERGSLPGPAALADTETTAAFGDAAVLGGSPVSVDDAIRRLIATVRDGDYLAVLAYVAPDDAARDAMQRIRARARDALGVATTAGFGPRFLHSTGQLHKGGPESGVFLQVTTEPERDLPIPGWAESFGTLIAAQALGDLESLQRRGRRVLRIHGRDAAAAFSSVEAAVADPITASV